MQNLALRRTVAEQLVDPQQLADLLLGRRRPPEAADSGTTGPAAPGAGDGDFAAGFADDGPGTGAPPVGPFPPVAAAGCRTAAGSPTGPAASCQEPTGRAPSTAENLHAAALAVLSQCQGSTRPDDDAHHASQNSLPPL
nr:hypothetical protein GCM10020092_007230 [Actinoplanes digitatis]